MKKYVVLFFFLIAIYSCKEEGVAIDFTPSKGKLLGDTEYISTILAVPQLHNVLLEDLTGVRCPNCPQAHVVAKSISDAYPGRIVISALHAYCFGFLTTPIPGKGFPDFRDSTADYIVTQLLDNPNGIPNGGINRKLYSEPKRWMPYSKWSNYVNSEINLQTPINLEITNSYNAAFREVTSVVKMECTQNINDTVYLSVGITENEIIGSQLDGAVEIQNYHHNHVFRKMLTGNTGLRVNSSAIILNAKQVVIRVFKYNLPAAWDVNNCNIIGILHKSSSHIDVIHCAEKKIL